MTMRLSPFPEEIRPFSVLRADRGPWQRRRRDWEAFGLTKSEMTRGRAHAHSYKLASGIGTVSASDPVLAEALYRWYCPPGGLVIDPFADGPTWGIVAATLGMNYRGVDLSERQTILNTDKFSAWRSAHPISGSALWTHGDAVDSIAAMPSASVDYVMTCPPYHNLERYSTDPRDLSAMTWTAFTTAYSAIIAEALRVLRPDRFASIIVGEIRASKGRLRGLVPLTITAAEAAGAKFHNDAVLINPIGTTAMRLGRGWRASRSQGRHHQYVITVVKGDPRAAAALIEADRR